ncbi:MAG: glutamate synthase large subunit [bacterium]|nr:glutamate synthase large subunit [bacterium]
MNKIEIFEKNGLYDSRFEHDACGVGFVCNIKGVKSNEIVKQGLEVLRRLTHRGATGADPRTGDGAGILIQMPHEFFVRKAAESKIKLSEEGYYGTGLVFLPTNLKDNQFCKEVFSKILKEEGQSILGWRKVALNNSEIGKTAQKSEPVIEQIFIGRNKNIKDQLAFERVLYIIRKRVENAVRNSDIIQKSFFYITNLSSKTFSYKGLLMPAQVENFFLDLKENDLKSSLCLVHSRYSTNTFPTWDLSQPFRYLAHNGEINTLRGNINWMRAREGLLKSSLFDKKLKNLFPVIVPGGSDSAALDNVFELLVLAGRPLPETMMMLIPSAWERNNLMDEKVKDFYKYHACLMEPWDGPAAIAFTDGSKIGALLDRNGLRPARYIVTKNDFVVMASEMGVLDIPAENIIHSGRLEPGKIFFIDTELGKIIDDAEVKEKMASLQPYAEWLDNMLDLDDIVKKDTYDKKSEDFDLLENLKAFGYTREDLKLIIKPMAETAQEPVGSMGNDTPLAVLSNKNQILYNYFKQLFAQVTNPPVDPIREEIVMSMESYLGPEKNIFEEGPAHCLKLRVKQPVLSNKELTSIINIKEGGFKTKVISVLFKVKNEKDFEKVLNKIGKDAEKAIKEGFTFIVLSDRGIDKDHASLPMLLALGAVHQHLVKKSMRKQISIFIESAEPREVHHFALLFGYGADCINPYLAYEAVNDLIKQDEIKLDEKTANYNYIKAVNKGIFKILSKMGISTLQSYKGAQVFEAIGLSKEVIDKSFTGTVSRIGGANLSIIAAESVLRHKEVYSAGNLNGNILASGGQYQWKKDGEFHLWNPETIAALQDAVRNEDYQKYKEFAGMINDQSKNPATLRSVLKLRKTNSIPLDEVEPVEKIFKRFVTGAMSFGSISKAAHESLAIAMNRIGGRSNTGEGGEDPQRFTPRLNGDSCRSAIKQVASGRFGVTTNYLVNADEIQIKISQGAKPGEGGQLPGHKVSAIIAKTRYTTAGVTLISPPPHHDIYSIEDLAQLIYDLKNVNPKARISVKLVSEIGVGTVAAGVAKGHADMILISGGDGGTGASPLSSIKHAGLPWELGLSETHQTLVLNDLRSRVRLQTDGQMRTGRDVAIAAMLGAEEYGFCTSALIILGCVMLRHCNLNNCSVGIATQDEYLESKFRGRSEDIVTYFNFVARELREIMAGLGIRKMDELIGETQLLEVNEAILPWKAKGIDMSRILYKPEMPKDVGRFYTTPQDHNINDVLDRKLIKLSQPALKEKKQVKIELPIENINRTTGAMLSGEICTKYGEEGLSPDTVYCKFNGVSGQSFGAFLAKGVTFELEGMANDYVGKGISGGKIIIYPDKKCGFKAEENIIMGNTTFYGAISGEAYIRGVAGERFCIRNSGLYAVVEGVGDHGCEYMTGGRVVVLGKTGRNFAAGMSGGIAYIYDKDKSFKDKCNMEMVKLEGLGKEDAEIIEKLISSHYKYTQSQLAKNIMDSFESEINKFVKVMPMEYKRILDLKKLEEKKGLGEVSEG